MGSKERDITDPPSDSAPSLIGAPNVQPSTYFQPRLNDMMTYPSYQQGTFAMPMSFGYQGPQQQGPYFYPYAQHSFTNGDPQGQQSQHSFQPGLLPAVSTPVQDTVPAAQQPRQKQPLTDTARSPQPLLAVPDLHTVSHLTPGLMDAGQPHTNPPDTLQDSSLTTIERQLASMRLLANEKGAVRKVQSPEAIPTDIQATGPDLTDASSASNAETSSTHQYEATTTLSAPAPQINTPQDSERPPIPDQPRESTSAIAPEDKAQQPQHRLQAESSNKEHPTTSKIPKPGVNASVNAQRTPSQPHNNHALSNSPQDRRSGDQRNVAGSTSQQIRADKIARWEGKFLNDAELKTRRENEANGNYLTCTRCREYNEPCTHELHCARCKAMDLPCIWIECKDFDCCNKLICPWIHKWQQLEFEASGLPWEWIVYRNEQLEGEASYSMPPTGAGKSFHHTANKNGWHGKTPPPHLQVMYGPARARDLRANMRSKTYRPNPLVDCSLRTQSRARQHNKYVPPLPYSVRLAILEEIKEANIDEQAPNKASETNKSQKSAKKSKPTPKGNVKPSTSTNMFNVLSSNEIDKSTMEKPITISSDYLFFGKPEFQKQFDAYRKKFAPHYPSMTHKHLYGSTFDEEVMKRSGRNAKLNYLIACTAAHHEMESDPPGAYIRKTDD